MDCSFFLLVLTVSTTSLGRAFVLSPGFGGLAAVLAASIAYLGVRRSARMQRETARKQQWWDRARWALDLTLDENSLTRGVGFGVLGALADSEYAAEHESEIVDAAVAPTLRTHTVTDVSSDDEQKPEEAQ